MPAMFLRRLTPLICLLPLLVAGCAIAPAQREARDLTSSPWAQASTLTGEGQWQHQTFKGRKNTAYAATTHEGRPALHARSDSGSSAMRYRVRVPSDAMGTLRFSWFVRQLNPAFDLTDREAEDAVARVILTFEGDRQRLTARDHMLSELAQLITGEPLPYATLMYVWDHVHPAGTVLEHPSTRRIRMLVVKSGPGKLGQWADQERDVLADFQHAFGETPQALTGIGLMTDGNNTRQLAEAWYGPVKLDRQVVQR
ncbi:DUF3047 domain-containing protein [Hydrogenophaga aquatica]